MPAFKIDEKCFLFESLQPPKATSEYLWVVRIAVNENNPSLMTINYRVHPRFTNLSITFTQHMFDSLWRASRPGLRGEIAQPAAAVGAAAQPEQPVAQVGEGALVVGGGSST